MYTEIKQHTDTTWNNPSLREKQRDLLSNKQINNRQGMILKRPFTHLHLHLMYAFSGHFYPDLLTKEGLTFRLQYNLQNLTKSTTCKEEIMVQECVLYPLHWNRILDSPGPRFFVYVIKSSMDSTTSATVRYSRMPLQTRMILRT